MRILVYGLNYLPELTGIGKYTGEMATWLAQRGHHVRVVTAPPYYPTWRIREDYRGMLYRTEHVPGGPTVHRTPLYVPERPTGLTRLVHLLSFLLGSLPVMLCQIFRRPDVVFTVEPTFFGAPLALLVAKAAGVPCWLHIQDFEVDAAFDLGLLPARGLLQDLALRLESFFTLAFDRVSSISVKMLERSCERGVSPDRVVLFRNWVDVQAIHPLDPETNYQSAIRRELACSVPNMERKIVLLYSGNMGVKQGLTILPALVEAFAPGGVHEDARVHFVLCGDGAFRSELEGLVAHHPSVSLLPLRPPEELNDLLNAADIHLLPQRVEAADLVMPSRLTGMFASGRPVVAVADPGTQIDLVVRGRGLVVSPGDDAALHDAVARLVDDEAMRINLGQAGRLYAVRNLGTEQVLMRLEADLMSLVAQSNDGRE